MGLRRDPLGGFARPQARERRAFSLEILRADRAPAADERPMLPLDRLPTFDERLRSIAGSVIIYQQRAVMTRYQELAHRLREG